MKKLCLVALIILSACAEKPVWTKSGASTEEFGKDKYSCFQGSMSSAPAVAGVNAYGSSASGSYGSNGVFAAKTQDINAGTRDQMFRACMESKGWLLQQPSPPPPPVPDAEVSLQKLSSNTLNNPRIARGNAEVRKCVQDRKDGILSSHKQSANCANQAVKSAFIDVGYPYLDLIDSLNAARLENAIKEDANKMTEADAKLAMKEKLSELVVEEMRRKSSGAPPSEK